MKTFVIKIFFIVTTLVLINLAYPLSGLLNLYINYRNPTEGVIKYIDPNHDRQKNTLVIGCSNLQHNINFKQVQDSLQKDVDFLYFPGNQNSTFMDFIFDEELTKSYENVILYVPYNMLKKEKYIGESDYHYQKAACYNYAWSNIKRNPENILINWMNYYDSICKYRGELYSSETSYLTTTDLYMDSILKNSVAFQNCNYPFNHNNQVIWIPFYEAQDVIYAKRFKKFNKNIFIIFSPIANIAENVESLKQSNILQMGFENVINKPFVLDSSLFYDQWYHLNACGRSGEIARMIHVLREVQAIKN